MTTALSIENGSSIEGRVLFNFNVWVPIGKCNRVSERQTKLRNQIFRALAASADVPSSVTETTDTTSTLQPPRPPLQTYSSSRYLDHLKMEMEMEIPSSSNVKLMTECTDTTYTCYEVMKDLIKVSKLPQTLISYSSSQILNQGPTSGIRAFRGTLRKKNHKITNKHSHTILYKMSNPANDDFSQHLSDGEESNHEDASDTGAAPKQPQPMIPQTTAISNIKLPILKKEEYDIWAMEMEHYLEYIDNEVWKVIQNGNSKKRISIGKDGVVRVLSPVTAAEIQAVEKERKAKNILLMAIPKEHMRRFHGMDDAKEIWEAIRTRFGGNANSKKMQKAVFKQQFEAFKISNSEGLEKGYDRFQQLLSQLEAHGAEVSTEDANHKFLRSLPSAWSNLAMTMRTNPEIDNLSIDDLYNNLRVFEQEIQGAPKIVGSTTDGNPRVSGLLRFVSGSLKTQSS
ncbi:hypothetical protein Tco_1568814 [Tanacetum coccineum]